MSEELTVTADAEDATAVPDDVDEAAVKRLDAAARVLDDGLRVPGTNWSIGLDPILGFLPVAGDSVAAALSAYIVVQSALLGVRYRTLFRMVLNIALDLVIGSIPLVGDVFDAFWKANRRNVNLAYRDLGVEQA